MKKLNRWLTEGGGTERLAGWNDVAPSRQLCFASRRVCWSNTRTVLRTILYFAFDTVLYSTVQYQSALPVGGHICTVLYQ
jgi:hypothetical protein